MAFLKNDFRRNVIVLFPRFLFSALAKSETLARISHGPVRNAHGVPIRHWRIGASRDGFRPGKLLSAACDG